MSRKVAAPVGPVVAVLLLAVAPAGLGVAVTTTLPALTGFPFASCNCTTGCCCSGAPFRAVLDGGVVSASLVAVPAFTLTVQLVTVVLIPDLSALAFSLSALSMLAALNV